ncbi:MAG: serine protein kinase PrkA [Deltaproteobacteria bacterium]|nr:serine protein kinase PrkA [Deltaproteobacteria bacterium]
MEHLLSKIEQQVKTEFERTNRILTFEEYMDVVSAEPKRHTRGSAQYVVDMMDHFGHVETKNGSTHFKLFDMDFGADGGDLRYRVIAQNDVQHSIYRSLQNFVKEGLNNKLVLLHGPNGSAKSSIVNCMTRGLEAYSETAEGATYKFNWIFPVDKYLKGGLGLATYTGAKNNIDSFAKLAEEEIAARVTCELRDHALLLLPAPARRDLLGSVLKGKGSVPDYLSKGDLCHKCKMIFEALLTAYRGDLKRVLQHVQVERFYVSKRYRTAAVTIEPQMHVDASVRQVTMDKSLGFLPASLQSVSLYELSGDLVDANRGIVEYADLLKRPVDTFKYLLIACESGSVNVGPSIAFLDTVMVGSTNELQLDAFKEFPDFTSFKARIELIRAPYLLEYSEEKKIYDISIKKYAGEKHVSPHTTFVAALWAVLTRLKKPNAIHYQPNLTNIIGALTPVEKARLYDHAGMPSHLSAEERKLLKATIRKLRDEYSTVPYYEGRMGASAREIKGVLYDAAQNAEFECLSPLSVMWELEEFIKRRTSEYDFLKQDVKDGYHDSGEFINVVRNEYLAILDQEVRESMGVFDTRQYEDFLKRYIINLSSQLKKEKIKNAITGKMENPDVHLIDEFEQIIEAPPGGAEREAFRNNVISSIGAYALDHAKDFAGQAVDYRLVFPEYMKKLEDHYFNQQKSQMRMLSDAIQFFGTEKEDRTTDHFKLATQTIGTMVKKLGYCEVCARQTILYLLKTKY